ncbi:hybrid sensor histidine kinase/response regulator [Diaphorobacter caeni]|uniref:hybrid sensor histidine kinase/response regulator n=1 Tax=Diaphorobacter caeni TaxID=2784387 RepID=UPI00188FD9AB|nr:Hpt domain-containing protein [Diaphorobacter caeni]MBF5002959.1 Hpt domain-containing protein [Diaphorobacter caeni]
MSSLEAVNASVTDWTHGEQDLGPLAWVLDELRKSLDGTVKSMRRFVRDAEVARDSDLASLDVSPLRMARQQIHQASGALEMVGMASPALILRALESAVQKYVQRPELCTDDAANTIERASFALIAYLESVLSGKPVSAVTLFPQYREAQALNGVERVHPADLWPVERRFREPEFTIDVPPQGYDAEARAKLDSAVLRIIKSGDQAADAELLKLCQGFAAGESDRQIRAFWKICSGFFEALVASLLKPDVYVKRVASRVLLQYATLAKGDRTVADRLVHELLFFCAQAKSPQTPQGPAHLPLTPVLDAVRQAFGLQQYTPVDYNVARFGLYDPTVLVQARKRIGTATETWSALAGGDRNKLKPSVDQFSLVCDSLRKLHPGSEPLAAALMNAVEKTAQSGEPPAPALAMEVATAVLYLQASFEELDVAQEHMGERAKRLAERLDGVVAGGDSEPLEPWMEELYRRVSDHQTMGSVVDELRATLGDAEKSLDQFFRTPEDVSVLNNVPGRLGQMRGVMSVLGLDQASHAVVHMRDTVERLIVGGVTEEERPAVFEKLGNSMGALGFLIDMLSYQRAMARKLFVYDEAQGELKLVMGRAKRQRASDQPETAGAVVDARGGAPVPQAEAATPVGALPVAEPVAEVEPATSQELQTLGFDTELDNGALAPIDSPVTIAVEPIQPPASAPLPAPEDEDDELLQIFLEEAREVIGNGTAAVDALHRAPADLSEQTTLRRAFHTLKGSSRMVGLNAFGEAAWSMEQMLNAWLAEQKPMQPDLLTLAQESLSAFGRWVDDIAAGTAASWSPQPFVTSADAMRTEGRLVPLVLDVEPAVAPVEPAAAPPEAPVSIEPALEEGLSLSVDEMLPVSVPAPLEPASDLTFDLPELSDEPAPVVAQAEQDAHAPLDFSPTIPFELEPADHAALAPTAAVTPLLDGDAAQEIDFAEFEQALKADKALQAPVHVANLEPHELPTIASVVGSDEPSILDQKLEARAHGTQPEAKEEPAPVALELPDLELPPVAEVPEAQELSVAELEDFGFENAPALVPEPPAAEQPAVATDLTGKHAEFFPIGEVEAEFVNDIEEPTPEPVEPEPLADVESVPQSFSDFVFEATPPVAEEVPELQEVAEEVEEAEKVEVPEAEQVVAVEDSTKVIGSLRISLPLFNVYLSEAEEWSQRLINDLQFWKQEQADKPVPESAIARAHSLAGSSATVGFTALSEMSRLLEHTLQHVQPQQFGVPAQMDVFLAVAEDIRRLLHQFAAGFLKEPNAQLLTQLHEILDTDVISGMAPLGDEEGEDDAATAVPEAPHQEDAEPVSFAAETAVAPLLPVEEAPVVTPEPVRGYVAPALSIPVPQMAVDTSPVAKASGTHHDDDIDAVDVIDPDLFPIFEEEAIELLPVLGGALRQWSMQPDNLTARSELLRALHTLKGSARLAGAMRLGEMAHRMETDVEHIDKDSAHTDDIEPLLGKLDALQESLDTLRDVGAQPLSEAVAVTTADDVVAVVPVAEVAQAAEPEPAAALQPLETAATQITMPPAVPAGPVARPLTLQLASTRAHAGQSVRVRSTLLDRLVNQAGEVMIARSRLDVRLGQMRSSLNDLTGNLERLRQQLRDIEVQAESQMQSRMALSKETAAGFDPLEFDRFTRVQELTRMMAESVNDVATVQRNLQRAMEGAEDDLISQGRQARELQRDLLRTRMVEFDSISERLYALVRQSSKETGKQIKLDIAGGSIEMDRGVLDRMTPAFEHLLRNCVSHGIEAPETRVAAGKSASGTILVTVRQDGNDVAVEFRDDGAGLNVGRIREKAIERNLITSDMPVSDVEAANLIFMPGFSTAAEVTGLSGRGIGMDVVRTEVNALGGRIETTTTVGQGTAFRLVLPLTTAVTQVVMLRAGNLSIGVPASLVEVVRRTTAQELATAYSTQQFEEGHENLPFFWSGALLQSSIRSTEANAKIRPVVILRSAAQRIAMHVDEVLGNQEVVVKNLGPQLSRLPGMAGMSVLASGAVVLIYNPVALANVFGARVQEATKAAQLEAEKAAAAKAEAGEQAAAAAAASGTPLVTSHIPSAPQVPLVLVVDDSITVRRVTQRLLQREGYRVSMAADGLQALERLQEERPTVVLSDIEMPRMDGFDLARNIRADERLKGLPIIMITSRIAEKHREHAMELGVNHYLGKPYSDEELMGLVHHYARLEAEAFVG